MSDDEFCTPQEAQQSQAQARRDLFPNAPAEIPCKLCRMMMPNPVIEYGVFSTWCNACIRSRCSKKTVRKMVNREKKRESNPNKSRLVGAAPPRPAAERMESKSTENGTYDGKPQLTLLSYLIHG